MLVLVTYDVSTKDNAGMKRLNKIAKICCKFGQRVQNSVFECLVSPDEWVNFQSQLLSTYKKEKDSLRFYFLGKNWQRKVEHHGTKSSFNPEGPLIF